MDNFHDIGGYLAQSTFLQLQLCLKALDLMDCKMAATQVDLAIHTMRQELQQAATTPCLLFRPDEDFAEMDAMASAMFADRNYWQDE